MNERDYNGNYILTKKDSLCLSTCVILLGGLVIFDIYLLLNYMFY